MSTLWCYSATFSLYFVAVFLPCNLRWGGKIQFVNVNTRGSLRLTASVPMDWIWRIRNPLGGKRTLLHCNWSRQLENPVKRRQEPSGITGNIFSNYHPVRRIKPWHCLVPVRCFSLAWRGCCNFKPLEFHSDATLWILTVSLSHRCKIYFWSEGFQDCSGIYSWYSLPKG